MINDPSCSSTGELIYGLAKQLVWPLAPLAQEMLMTAILGDTQGLSNQLTNARTYRIMAEMTEAGIDRQKLEELRREYSKMPVEIYTYKATLINRTEFVADNRVAMVAIPQAEISHYSPLYNPAPLIQNDMLQTEGVLVSIVFKHYADGKITAAIRCNSSAPIGSKLAEHFGGGGHPYASGFKINGGRSFAAVKSECAAFATELLDNQPIEN
jgi:phosphoesterase RecJ-like protein